MNVSIVKLCLNRSLVIAVYSAAMVPWPVLRFRKISPAANSFIRKTIYKGCSIIFLKSLSLSVGRSVAKHLKGPTHGLQYHREIAFLGA